MSQFDIDLLRQINAIERRVDALERVEYGGSIVAAKYRTNAGQSISNNPSPFEIVNYEDLVYDTHSAVTVGASWKFTAPLAGYYHVTAYNMFTNTTGWAETEQAVLQLFKNGAVLDELARVAGQDFSGLTQFKALRGSSTLYLAISDYIDVRIYQNSGASLALHNSGAYNYIAIEKVN